jgi:2-polyprenyl-3-methyl-5-hydroxy-6-metoxy-1,4-benzoquinol methylase
VSVQRDWAPAAVRRAVQHWWARYFSFTYETLERTFQEQTDPWGFAASRFEQERFALMVGLLQTVPHETILEVGCAEGDFTEQLVGIAKQVTAIDLSGEAIARARLRAPQARYIVTKIEDYQPQGTKFDVVVCGEMLYYISDKEQALANIERLGQYLLVSNCNQFAVFLEPRLARYTLIRRLFHFSVRELKCCAISLRRL